MYLKNRCDLYTFTKTTHKGSKDTRVYKAVSITDIEKQTVVLDQKAAEMIQFYTWKNLISKYKEYFLCKLEEKRKK